MKSSTRETSTNGTLCSCCQHALHFLSQLQRVRLSQSSVHTPAMHTSSGGRIHARFSASSPSLRAAPFVFLAFCLILDFFAMRPPEWNCCTNVSPPLLRSPSSSPPSSSTSWGGRKHAEDEGCSKVRTVLEQVVTCGYVCVYVCACVCLCVSVCL